MPLTKIFVDIVVDPNCSLVATPPIPIPQQSFPVEIIWGIHGATFDPTGGITLTAPFPPNAALPMGPPAPVGDGTWSLIMQNSDLATNGTFGYVVNYNCQGQAFSSDPTIENQPPPPQ